MSVMVHQCQARIASSWVASAGSAVSGATTVAFDLASRLASDRVLLGPNRQVGAEGDFGDAEFLVESPMLAWQLV